MDKVYYNYYANGLITCSDENVLCPRCKGHGYHVKYDGCVYSLDEDDILECYICKGLGNIDWITNVMEAGWETEELALIRAGG